MCTDCCSAEYGNGEERHNETHDQFSAHYISDDTPIGLLLLDDSLASINGSLCTMADYYKDWRNQHHLYVQKYVLTGDEELGLP